MNEALKKRCSIIFLLSSAFFLVIIFNLYRIQIWHTEFYKELGTQQYYGLVKQSPPRASVFDRNGTVIAMNQELISAFILPKHIKHRTQLETYLSKEFPHILDQLRTKNGKRFIYVKRRLSPEQIASIKEEKIDDIHFVHEPSRFYPVPAVAPLIGHTDIDNNGVEGIELTYNEQLAGSPAVFHLAKDARSGQFHFSKNETTSLKEGTPLYLSIDSDIQFLAYEAVKMAVEQSHAQEGSALVINPDNGEIIAMVNYSAPGYGNDTVKNRPVTDAYELGSVIKTFAALAALEENVVTMDETIDCKNSLTTYIDGRKINTIAPHGLISFKQVVAFSNNIGSAIVSKRLDEKLYDHYVRLGFGKKTGIAFPGENAGFVQHPSCWSKQSIISLSYGYEITSTLLQLACAFCIIANGGYPITPSLLLTYTPIPKTAPLYSSESLNAIREILEHTTEHGTTRRARINGYRIMSKTGTANLLINGSYRDTENIFTCAGIIEKNSYRRVMVTFVKQARGNRLYAATVAAPLFEKIAKHLLIHDKII